MSSFHSNDPFQPPENSESFSNISAPPTPVQGVMPAIKRSRTSNGVRLVLGGVLVVFLSLAGWIGALVLFSKPTVVPPSLVTLPILPPGSPPTVPAVKEVAIESAAGVASEIPADVRLESPGTGTESLAVLREKLSGTASPAPSLFLEMAAACEAENRHGEAAKVLKKGMIEHPGNDDLFLALADNTLASGNPEEAWQQVARTGRLEDPRYASRILRFGIAAAKYDETLVILSSSGTGNTAWSEAEWIMIASLYENTGQLDSAIETVNRRVSEQSEIYRLRARQEMLNENFAEAIFNQEQYIARIGKPSAEAWRTLATLYAAVGRSEEAERAREQSAAARGDEPAGGSP